MIASELLVELKSVRRNFDWSYYGSTRKIRGKLKSQSNGALFDPIGAVCFAKTGAIFGESQWLTAAAHLDLSHIAAGDLTAAANNVPPDQDQVYLHDLRRRMIGGLLLQPESDFASGAAAKLIARYLPTLLRKRAHGGAKY